MKNKSALKIAEEQFLLRVLVINGPGVLMESVLSYFINLSFVFIFSPPRLTFYAISGGKVFFPISYTCN